MWRPVRCPGPLAVRVNMGEGQQGRAGSSPVAQRLDGLSSPVEEHGYMDEFWKLQRPFNAGTRTRDHLSRTVVRHVI